MEISDLGNVLKQYLNAPPGAAAPQAEEHFDQVAQAAPPEVLSHGLAEAFRSDRTPPFGQMLGSLFGNGNPSQRAGMLSQLLGALGPGVLAGLAGGALRGLGGQSTGGPATVTPQQASQLSPAQVEELANHAEKQDPGVIDRVSGFFAQHPDLIKGLGGAALAIAMGQMAQRMKR